MGEGLQRAIAAARATGIKPEHVELLRLVSRHPSGAQSYDMPMCTRANDRIRQACRRFGWMEYRKGRWHLTESGRSVITS